MKCWNCGVHKLSQEFPPWTLEESCNHAVLHCLRCVTEFAKAEGQCSQCKTPLSPDSSRLKQCYCQLNALFPEYKPTFVPQATSQATGGKGYISVAMLNGDSIGLPLNASMMVYQLMQIVRDRLKVPLESQQLIYNGNEMKEFTDSQAQATLGDYEVQPGATVHVRRLLYSVPKALDNVVFDLYWGYPVTMMRDYLDASVLVFKGVKFNGVLDYIHTARPSMRHSGDVMDDTRRIGHHLINVDLHSIPSAITHIFFTLSAWNSPNVSKYPNPTLRFYEQSNPGKMLCEDTIKKLNYSQAIVMGWLARQGGNWCVFSAGKASAGNAKNYKPLVATVQGIITNGL